MIDGNTSDGYHTFNELYDHRARLFIALCKTKNNAWCSICHSDGSKFDNMFILGIGKEKGKQITYHLSSKYWSEVTEFVPILVKAPEWDKHTPEDVLERLKDLI